MMYHIDSLNFYITDRCDLACTDCITYNNWSWGTRIDITQHSAQIARWAELISLGELCVLGGEATLDPDLPKWVSLLGQLWPQARRRITTNGRHLDRIDLDWIAQGWHIEVGAHSQQDRDRARLWAQHTWPQCVITTQLTAGPHARRSQIITVDDRVAMEITESWRFVTWPWQLKQGRLVWDRVRDPQTEYQHCQVKMCRYMLGHTLYRCPQQALFPRITAWVAEPWQQITAEDLGCTPDSDVDQWFSTEWHSQSQCQLCAWSQHSYRDLTQGRKIPIRVG